MFDIVRKYVWDRRRGLSTAAGVVGGVYLVGQYVIRRLEEMRERVLQDRAARENLRKRFQQNLEDCTYHILALLPTLGNAILEEMDVERITLALQQSRAAAIAPAPHPPAPPSTLSASFLSDSIISQASSTSATTESSVDSTVLPAIIAANTDPIPSSNEESNPTAGPSDPRHTPSPPPSDTAFDTSGLVNSSADWVSEFRSQMFAQSEQDEGEGEEGVRKSPKSISGMSESYVSGMESGASVSGVTDESYGQESGVMLDISGMSASEFDSRVPSPPLAPQPPLSSKSKAELWKEMKILVFTRAVTILYSLSLLTLLTHIQLNLLGTRKYVESVRHMARNAESSATAASVGSLFWGTAPPFQQDTEEELEEGEPITEELEQKYLTMTWWLLNVGWKDVAARVRSAVESVFQSISLKANLSPQDVERLIADIRRRVEYETPESEKRVSFLSTILPAYDSDREFVLLQGGIASHEAVIDPLLGKLLDETSDFISSADFGVMLGLCVDRGTRTLLDGLRENAFGQGANGQGLGVAKIEEVFDEQLPPPLVRLAELLPAVARWSHLAVNGIPNELVEGLAEMREMTAFSAILYSSFAERI